MDMFKNGISLALAILIGHIIVTIPSMVIFFGTLLFLLSVNLDYLFSVLIGGVLSWIYWSYFIPRWRNWALEKGVEEEKLYKWGRLTLLTWKKGSVFEKTEFSVRKKKYLSQ